MPPFVVPVDPVVPERLGSIDVYRPPQAPDGPLPVVVFVHGGPRPAEQEPTPRDTPLFQGYASLAAQTGAIGVMFNHRLHDSSLCPTAADDVAAAVNDARALEGADPDRVVIWAFSGGGLLMADWFAAPPPWLRGVAVSYPLLGSVHGFGIVVNSRFHAVDSLSGAGNLPILLTRVGREQGEIASLVAAFVSAAAENKAHVDIIDLPDGQHAFDMFDDTDTSRQAVHQAMTWVQTTLNAR